MSNFEIIRGTFKNFSLVTLYQFSQINSLTNARQHMVTFLALLAKGQKGLCRPCVRPSVRKQFLVNTIQSSVTFANKPDPPMQDWIMALEIVKIAIIELVNTI